MEFEWSVEQQRFREEVRSFIQQELPPDWERISQHGPASRSQVEFSKEFCARAAAAGLLIPHWPHAHGGRDATPWEHFILGEECWSVGEPRGPQYMNVNWIGPVVLRYGNEAQQAEHLPPIARGEVIWCQGFSEPNAGSDLAALRTRAEPTEDGYVINGSKIWTSYASLADYCFLLARTGDGKANIAIFLVPMTSPGIDVRPIPSLLGRGDVHEVFFTDVQVPASFRLGAEGQGWEIVNYGLQYERIGLPRYAFARTTLERAVARLKSEGRFDGTAVRERAAAAVVACDAAQMLVYRVVADRARGAPPDAYSNVARSAVIQAEHRVSEFIFEHLPAAMCEDPSPTRTHHERAIASGIASGAAEIQLDLIARRFLQLPKGGR